MLHHWLDTNHRQRNSADTGWSRAIPFPASQTTPRCRLECCFTHPITFRDWCSTRLSSLRQGRASFQFTEFAISCRLAGPADMSFCPASSITLVLLFSRNLSCSVQPSIVSLENALLRASLKGLKSVCPVKLALQVWRKIDQASSLRGSTVLQFDRLAEQFLPRMCWQQSKALVLFPLNTLEMSWVWRQDNSSRQVRSSSPTLQSTESQELLWVSGLSQGARPTTPPSTVPSLASISPRAMTVLTFSPDAPRKRGRPARPRCSLQKDLSARLSSQARVQKVLLVELRDEQLNPTLRGSTNSRQLCQFQAQGLLTTLVTFEMLLIVTGPIYVNAAFRALAPGRPEDSPNQRSSSSPGSGESRPRPRCEQSKQWAWPDGNPRQPVYAWQSTCQTRRVQMNWVRGTLVGRTAWRRSGSMVVDLDQDQQSMEVAEQETIRVVIRVKPVPREQFGQHRSVQIDPLERSTLVVQAANKREYFTFDFVAAETTTQQELFEQLGRPLVRSVLQGYNGCVFAYGQTGAGKTHSILGAELDSSLSEERGLLPRILEVLFAPNEECQVKEVSCSYLQIYNEQLNDLLRKDGKNLLIREDARKSVYVEGLSEERAPSCQDAIDLIRRGLRQRKVAFTDMNAESSRSHTVFTINLRLRREGPDRLPQELNSKLHVVDLAGSERQKSTNVEGDRLKEGCNINKSLTVLGTVINSLVESQKSKKHVSYRDSKLTFFLRDSLGGSAVTRLLACINPNEKYIFETLSTLKFAARAKVLRIRAEQNEVTGLSIDHLRGELKRTKLELNEARHLILELKSSQDSRPLPTPTSLTSIQPPTAPLAEDHSDFVRQTLRKLQILQKNELLYRGLIVSKQKSDSDKRVDELLRNVPAFSRIFGENLRLKEQIKQLKRKFSAAQQLSLSEEGLPSEHDQPGQSQPPQKQQAVALNQSKEQTLLRFTCDCASQYQVEFQQTLLPLTTPESFFLQTLLDQVLRLRDQLSALQPKEGMEAWAQTKTPKLALQQVLSLDLVEQKGKSMYNSTSCSGFKKEEDLSDKNEELAPPCRYFYSNETRPDLCDVWPKEDKEIMAVPSMGQQGTITVPLVGQQGTSTALITKTQQGISTTYEYQRLQQETQTASLAKQQGVGCSVILVQEGTCTAAFTLVQSAVNAVAEVCQASVQTATYLTCSQVCSLTEVPIKIPSCQFQVQTQVQQAIEQCAQSDLQPSAEQQSQTAIGDLLEQEVQATTSMLDSSANTTRPLLVDQALQVKLFPKLFNCGVQVTPRSNDKQVQNELQTELEAGLRARVGQLQRKLGEQEAQLGELREEKEHLDQTLTEIRIKQMASLQEEDLMLKGHVMKDTGEQASRQQLAEQLQAVRHELQFQRQSCEQERQRNRRLREKLKKGEGGLYSSMITDDR